MHPLGRRAGLDGVRIVDTCRAAPEQPQVAVHGVLVERNQQVDAVAHVGDRFRSGSNGQKRVPAPNNRLIGVVGIQAQTPSTEDFRENIPWRGHTLARRATNGDRKGLFHGTLSGWEFAWELVATVLYKLRAYLEE